LEPQLPGAFGAYLDFYRDSLAFQKDLVYVAYVLILYKGTGILSYLFAISAVTNNMENSVNIKNVIPAAA
jgi:hypothetical protein